MCAFAILGAVGGFLGNIAGIYLGLYWKFLAGFISILFGLAVLGLLPFVSSKAFSTENWGKSSSGAILYGLTVGGGAATCSVFCSPVILVALTVAILQGHTLWGTAILMSFSIGYGLPVAGVLFGLGLGLGKLTSLVDAIKPVVQTAAGTMLIAVGFYLLSNY
jgi:cytochrome c biogenesis protein CcdA